MVAASGIAFFLGKFGIKSLFAQESLKMLSTEDSKTISKKVKKEFSKSGCSGAMYHSFNQAFQFPYDTQGLTLEQYMQAFGGGLMRKGYQCGLLTGATVAIGAEAFHRYKDRDTAILATITATQSLRKAFIDRKGTVNCRNIINMDISTGWGLAKYMLSGKAISCINMAKKWAPDAIEAANNGLTLTQIGQSTPAMNCASVIAQKMKANDFEMVLASGFAGGLGLSGDTCGAMITAVWINTVKWYKAGNEVNLSNPNAEKTLKVFSDATNGESLCSKICGQRFTSIDEHSKFIKNGGCKKIIDILADC